MFALSGLATVADPTPQPRAFAALNTGRGSAPTEAAATRAAMTLLAPGLPAASSMRVPSQFDLKNPQCLAFKNEVEPQKLS